MFCGTPYVIYGREKVFYNLFSGWWFFMWNILFPSRFLFFKYVTLYIIYTRESDCFRHADGFSFSFVLIQKKRKRKEKIKATSPGLLRNGRSGAEKWTRSVALRSDNIFQRRPAIPPLTPLRLGRSFFYAKALRCWFCFFRCCFMPYLFSYRVFLDLSHREICYFTRNSLYLGWVYIYLA